MFLIIKKKERKKEKKGNALIIRHLVVSISFNFVINSYAIILVLELKRQIIEKRGN